MVNFLERDIIILNMQLGSRCLIHIITCRERSHEISELKMLAVWYVSQEEKSAGASCRPIYMTMATGP